MAKPSRRKEIAMNALTGKGVSIRLACRTFDISETFYWYGSKPYDENTEIVDYLIRITHNQKNWGIGLCHKRVYRMYRELELNSLDKAQEAHCPRVA